MPNENTIKRIVEFAGRLKDVDSKILKEGLEIIRLHHQVEQTIENECAGWGLTPRQVDILEVLYHNAEGTLTPADLSAEVGLTRSAMTSALDSLEKLGYTLRRPHPSDRRMLTISLTHSGRSFISQHLPERYRRICRLMGSMSKAERKVLVMSFAKVLAFLTGEMEVERK
jgi:DNA-binding MarR family transcriptional regulator